ncbi:MAG TPA: SGNH/GDSL hydrolase family protein [Sphingobacteriaceae bacterium]
MKPEIRYLALGDSYTVGESLEPSGSFPYQLAERLRARVLIRPTVVAKTGWTTDELLGHLAEHPVDGSFDLVSLLIGVNNQYRDYPLDTYQKEFSALLGLAIDFAGGNKERVIVISIPDWGVTPFASGDQRSASEIAAGIDRFNAVSRKVTGEADVRYISITEDSRKAATDPGLIAADGLHPSENMYSGWVDRISCVVEDLLDS